MNRVSRWILCSIALAGVALAQGSAGTPAAIPRLADGRPDLNGVWDIPYTPDMSRGIGGEKEMPYTPLGLQEWKSYSPANFDSTGHCLPAGLTRSINTPMPIEILQSKDKVAILFEGFSSFLSIHTDGRKHPENPNPTWMGDSVGWYEGDTLVIDTIGFNDRTRLDTIGHPHSDQLHVVQRLTRSDATHIAFEITVEDPKMYTKPIVNKRTFTLKPTWDLMEYSCMENNKDLLEGHLK
jgi:hypothetical protein